MQGVVSRVGFSRGSSEPCKSRIINTEVLPCLVWSELGAASYVNVGRFHSRRGVLWRVELRQRQSRQGSQIRSKNSAGQG